ncbi:putative HVA22-like protein g [Malania oleifera]|uniref:putative HVA22-like protein g n=1 Tax=Malania oleifera TaxID=397392 RepID=UPI0025AE9784|nr:putative HVA22-like protein g [Malania oleifera]
MLGDFITRILVLILGYAYPAFECYKTVEKNRVEIEELRFWCQYWIIVALLTASERIGDIFISWLPMYGEMKLALLIYLWHPKTKGSWYAYNTLLRPYVAKHETEIDRKLEELRARAWDFALYYWENCTKLGQTTFFQVIQYVASQSAKFKTTTASEAHQHVDQHPRPSAPPFPENSPPSFNSPRRRSSKSQPPTPSATAHHTVFQPPQVDHVQLHPHIHTEFIRAEDMSPPEPTTPIDETLYAARVRLRHSRVH